MGEMTALKIDIYADGADVDEMLDALKASPRELLNLVQADQIGCHVITVTPDILKKLSMLGKDLAQLSLETVQMFHNDAQKAGYSLRTDSKVA